MALDTINIAPPSSYVCLINTVRKKGVYNWERKPRITKVGSHRYSALTIAIKDSAKVYGLTSFSDIYPSIDCN